jgi:LacI family transcriptional regulator
VAVTISDVASRAGVSKTTVSRVLNDRGELTPGTVQRVRDAIAELGYVPSAGAVGLARGRTQLMGMFVPSVSEPWIGRVVDGAVETLEREGYGLRLFTFHHGEESLRKLGFHAAAKAFDGLLVIEPPGTLPYITELYQAGFPVVMVDDRGHLPELPHVAATNRAGAADAARHLLDLGRTRPLIVTGPVQYGCTGERLAGFGEVYAEAGWPIEAELVFTGDFGIAGGRDAIRRALAHDLHFDAVFAHNDRTAAGVIAALRAAGRHVPHDVAVVGFDDLDVAWCTDPALTTVRQPFREMGATAADMLFEHVRGDAPTEKSRTVATTLVVRDSTVEPDAR